MVPVAPRPGPAPPAWVPGALETEYSIKRRMEINLQACLANAKSALLASSYIPSALRRGKSEVGTTQATRRILNIGSGIHKMQGIARSLWNMNVSILRGEMTLPVYVGHTSTKQTHNNCVGNGQAEAACMHPPVGPRTHATSTQHAQGWEVTRQAGSHFAMRSRGSFSS